jgi:two-component system chemotaxis response regulator CheY
MSVSLNKVLIIDDSKLVHQMYRILLMRYKGCKIVDAMNGLEALEILSRENDFDLIILDINMPVMNGVQFMEKFRENGRFQHIPVIVISTEGREEDTLKMLKLGAKGYITKPLKPEVLHSLIEKLVGKKEKVEK